MGWGREIAHLDLHTAGGPSWKPLPMLFTTLFAPFGGAQPQLWLVLARAGALMAIAMAFRLAYRLTAGLPPAPAGPGPRVRLAALTPALLAGAIAAASLALSGGFLVENALGYSEGLAVALILVAVDRLLDGAPRQALFAGFLAGLDRPELWFFWLALAGWLVWRDPAARRLVVGLGMLLPLLWFLPELWGSGELFRSVIRARQPVPGTAAFSGCPLCTVLTREAWPAMPAQIELAAFGGVLAAAAGLWHARRGGPRASRPRLTGIRAWVLVVAGAGFLWWVGIAAETQAGFAGDRRYLEVGTALVAIAGGVAWGWLAGVLGRAVGRRVRVPRSWSVPAATLGAAGALVGIPPWIGHQADLSEARQALGYQAGLRSDLRAAVERSGGAAALLRCGTVMTEGYQVPMLAWMLGVPLARIESPPPRRTGSPWPAVILQDRATSGSALLPAPAQIQAWEHDGARYYLLARVRSFRVFSTCPHKVVG